MQKTFRRLLLVITGVGIATAGYLYYRNSVIDRLYAEAAGYPPYLRGSNEAQAAVKKLATYRGQRSTSMLLDIAVGHGPAQLIWPDTQAEAIKALRERRDPEIAVTLANLLHPHEGLGTRQAVAAALKYLPCKGECIRSILHYLERIWRGEPNHEDRWVDSLDSSNGAIDLKKEEEAFYGDLYLVLRQEKTETLANLAEVYGLGSMDPSPFALDLVSRLGLDEACPYLLQSDQQLKKLSSEFYKAPREELSAAIASLNCK